jgi:hypothetical protein
MSLHTKFLPVLILIVVFGSCDKGNDDDAPQPSTVDSFQLITPPLNAVTAFDSVLFTWKGSADTYRLQIDNGIILDTILTSKSYLLHEKLTPGITVSWRVISGTDTLSRAFKTENLTQDYVGFHTMNLHKYYYGNPQFGFPDSFISNVTVSIQLVDSNKLRISYSTVFDKQLSFAPYLTDDSVIGYGFTGAGSGQTCFFRHNFRTDSIYISNSNGGLGSGVSYYFRGHR